MPGLIQGQMGVGQPTDAAGQAPQQMPQQMGQEGAQGAQDPSENPGYQQAVQLAMEALYSGKAAKDVARGMKGARDPVETLANTAYEIVSIVDERTQGAIPDEMLVPFAVFVLGEVAEIAQAANVNMRPADIVLALKQMILRYLGEQGVDTTQLQQAMDQADPEEIVRMAGVGGEEEMEGAETEEEVPV